ncbi:tRNA selenocysteine 1-associated protein 1-like isoform X2 [Teleopsis dalmanni]|nr:tRNA selenocysteine 1-associated protein 1-like isoform X2 [Teleopsis dalmanni]
MNETFIKAAFRKVNENPKFVNIIRDRQSGQSAGYCFIRFKDDQTAWNAMNKLNGKLIPNTDPPVRFRLNFALHGEKNHEPVCSIWVGSLSSDISRYQLYRVFSKRFASAKNACVIYDRNGIHMGYGFVEFGSEEDAFASVEEMDGYDGLGTRVLKVRISTKNKKVKLRYNKNDQNNAVQNIESKTIALPKRKNYQLYQQPQQYNPQLHYNMYQQNPMMMNNVQYAVPYVLSPAPVAIPVIQVQQNPSYLQQPGIQYVAMQ